MDCDEPYIVPMQEVGMFRELAPNGCLLPVEVVTEIPLVIKNSAPMPLAPNFTQRVGSQAAKVKTVASLAETSGVLQLSVGVAGFWNAPTVRR
jgi:hypothetical protein